MMKRGTKCFDDSTIKKSTKIKKKCRTRINCEEKRNDKQIVSLKITTKLH